MAVRIRLKRFGNRNRAFWRVVVTDGRMPRDGRFIEEIGVYQPLPADEKIEIKSDRLDYWLKKGAQPSVSVKSLIKRKSKKTKKTAGK